MNVARLRGGEILAGLGSILLTVMLCLHWARPEAHVRSAPGVDLSTPLRSMADKVVGAFLDQYAQSGWSALGWLLVLMLLVSILGGLGLVALTLMERDTPVLPVVAAVCTTGWTAITALVLFVRLTLVQPGLELGWGDADVDILAPAWIGFLALVAIGAGGWLTLRDDRLDSPQSAPPEVPVRPAPPATA